MCSTSSIHRYFGSIGFYTFLGFQRHIICNFWIYRTKDMIFASFRNFLFYFLNRFLFNRGTGHVAWCHWLIPVRPDLLPEPLDLKSIWWSRLFHTDWVKWSIVAAEERGRGSSPIRVLGVVGDGIAVLRWSSTAMLRCSPVTVRWSTRSGVTRRCRMRGRHVRVLPGTALGNRRRGFGYGELRSSRATLISYVKSVGKNITRCARRRGEGECQNRAAVYLGWAEICEKQWPVLRTPARYSGSLGAIWVEI
jgi:hypothetical protein